LRYCELHKAASAAPVGIVPENVLCLTDNKTGFHGFE